MLDEYMARKRIGFTLVELLVASMLVSIVGLAVYSTLCQGLAVWKRAVREDFVIDTDFFLERLAQDLRNPLLFTQPSFSGKKEALEFFSFAAVNGKKSSLSSSLPAQVSYVFDRKSREVRKREVNYVELLHPGQASLGTEKMIMNGIENLTFQYYAYDDRTQSFRWWDHWTGSCFPKAVQVRAELASSEKQVITRIIPIPITYCSA